MVYAICAAVFFILTGLSLTGIVTVSPVVTGIFALIAGIAILIGVFNAETPRRWF